MTNLYAEDYLNKHPLEPAPWDLPDPECRSCGWGDRETEQCTLCACEAERPVQIARDIILPALAWARSSTSVSPCAQQEVTGATPVGSTIPAPDGSAEAPAAPMSVATVYRAIRSPGMLGTMVFA